MKSLTKETAGSLAKVLDSRLSTIHGDDMVAILGVGRESSNEKAIQSWLMSRFTDIGVFQGSCRLRLIYAALFFSSTTAGFSGLR
ncbi:hypothetical protein AB4876_09130 [Zhongshania guokunii]|uniref:Uncharacterized protein n=1 Tax=Zhongshania guokunii TaxID=641783 RepID=A0ABV3U599_9GAMM